MLANSQTTIRISAVEADESGEAYAWRHLTSDSKENCKREFVSQSLGKKNLGKKQEEASKLGCTWTSGLEIVHCNSASGWAVGFPAIQPEKHHSGVNGNGVIRQPSCSRT